MFYCYQKIFILAALQYNVLPIYFPVSSSSPLFLSLDPSLAEGGSGVFFPPFAPFPADFGLSFPLADPFFSFPLSLAAWRLESNYMPLKLLSIISSLNVSELFFCYKNVYW